MTIPKDRELKIIRILGTKAPIFGISTYQVLPIIAIGFASSVIADIIELNALEGIVVFILILGAWFLLTLSGINTFLKGFKKPPTFHTPNIKYKPHYSRQGRNHRTRK